MDEGIVRRVTRGPLIYTQREQEFFGGCRRVCQMQAGKSEVTALAHGMEELTLREDQPQYLEQRFVEAEERKQPKIIESLEDFVQRLQEAYELFPFDEIPLRNPQEHDGMLVNGEDERVQEQWTYLLWECFYLALHNGEAERIRQLNNERKRDVALVMRALSCKAKIDYKAMLELFRAEGIVEETQIRSELEKWASLFELFLVCEYEIKLMNYAQKPGKQDEYFLEAENWKYLERLLEGIRALLDKPLGVCMVQSYFEQMGVWGIIKLFGILDAAKDYVDKFEASVYKLNLGEDASSNDLRLKEAFKAKLRGEMPLVLRLCFSFMDLGLRVAGSTETFGISVMEYLRKLERLEMLLEIEEGQYGRLYEAYIEHGTSVADKGVLLDYACVSLERGHYKEAYYYAWMLFKMGMGEAIILLLNVLAEIDFSDVVWEGFDFEAFLEDFYDLLASLESASDKERNKLLSMDLRAALGIIYVGKPFGGMQIRKEEKTHSRGIQILKGVYDDLLADTCYVTPSLTRGYITQPVELTTSDLEKLAVLGYTVGRALIVDVMCSRLRSEWLSEALYYLGLYFFDAGKKTSAYNAFNLARIYSKTGHAQSWYYASMMAYYGQGRSTLTQQAALKGLEKAQSLGSAEAKAFLEQLKEREQIKVNLQIVRGKKAKQRSLRKMRDRQGREQANKRMREEQAHFDALSQEQLAPTVKKEIPAMACVAEVMEEEIVSANKQTRLMLEALSRKPKKQRAENSSEASKEKNLTPVPVSHYEDYFELVLENGYRELLATLFTLHKGGIDFEDPTAYCDRVKIGAKEIKAFLVEGLGCEIKKINGKQQGKGSHTVISVPRIDLNPRAKMKAEGFVSPEPAQRMVITLAKHKWTRRLLPYEVFAIRNALMRMGYTPLTLEGTELMGTTYV